MPTPACKISSIFAMQGCVADAKCGVSRKNPRFLTPFCVADAGLPSVSSPSRWELFLGLLVEEDSLLYLGS